ncbi:MAG: hypothetical protein ACFHU9_07680 [Fluviicola sp.]
MRLFVISLLCFFPLIGSAQNCEDYKTGTFKCRLEGGEWIENYKIIRKNKWQLEYSPDGFNKSKVVWLDSCSYDLIHIKSDYLDLPKGNVTHVKIVRTTKNGYVAVGSSDAFPGRQRRIEMEQVE